MSMTREPNKAKCYTTKNWRISTNSIVGKFGYFCQKKEQQFTIKHFLKLMNKYIIFAFLLICQNLFAQEEDKKAGTQAYKEFNEWLNDTIPTITDQYSLTYNHDLERYEELNVRILVNAEVKNGKMTILNSTSRKHNLDYVMNLIKDFHTTLPQNYRLHMEETVLYQPNCYGCPLEEDGYTSLPSNINHRQIICNIRHLQICK